MFIYFVRSGIASVTNGSANVLGSTSYYLSNSNTNTIWGYTGLGVYFLYIQKNGLDPNYGPTSRLQGYPIRCLVY